MPLGTINPLFFSGGEGLVEFVTSRRQQIFEILRKFQIVSLAQIGLLVDVTRYVLSSLRVPSRRFDVVWNIEPVASLSKSEPENELTSHFEARQCHVNVIRLRHTIGCFVLLSHSHWPR